MTTLVLPYTNIAIGWSPALQRCDVRIAATGSGRGTVVIDRTPASTFLIAMGSYQRARNDDRIPGTLNGVAPGGLLSARGWVGDALRTDGGRTGCRLWLLSDAKQTEATRQDALQYLDESIGQIATNHGHSYNVDAAWTAPGKLVVTARAFGTVVSTPVSVRGAA